MTVTVSVSSSNLDLLDDLDISALENLSLDFSGVLASLDAITNENAVTTLSSTQIAISNSGSAVNILGQGFSPTSSVDALGEAFVNGTVRGTVSALTVTQSGTEVLGVSLSPTSYEIQYDDLTLDITGTLPTRLSDILATLIAIISLSEPEFLTDDEIAEQTAVLAAYQVTNLALANAGTELVSVSFGTSAVSVELGDFTLVINGSFPSDLGGVSPLISLLPALLGGAEDIDPNALTALDIDDVTILAPDNSQIIQITGNFLEYFIDPNATETYLVDGVPFDYVTIDLPFESQVSNYILSEYGSSYVAGLAGNDTIVGVDGTETLVGGKGNDVLTANGPSTTLFGGLGNDRLHGSTFSDSMFGGDGVDTLIGGDGDDFIFGGETSADLRDVVYGGNGNDSINGGYGNDELRGDAGNDSIEGGFGVDTVIGGDGDDVLTGSAWSDAIFGGNGVDFINGGFGFDRVNGGAGGDRFFHLGVLGHGSDWIQDFTNAQGDRLVYGGVATAAQFQVNFANTANAGDAGVDEAFVIHIPTRQILWALVDGGAQAEINIQLGGQVVDLLG